MATVSEATLRPEVLVRTMDALTSPKFKSKVEKFYYENRTNSELDLRETDEVFKAEESPKRSMEMRRIEDARRRAYSGERRGVFNFEPEDIKSINQKQGSLKST